MSDEQAVDVAEQQTEAPRERSPLEAAKARLADLERKLAGMGERVAVNRAAREAMGPDADKRSLADLRNEAVRLGVEAEDLRAWVARARSELEAAEAAELVAADIVLIRHRLELAGAFRRVGALIDEAMTPQRLEAWLAVAEQIRRTRLASETFTPGPSEQQVAVLGLAALQTFLMATPWKKEFRHLAPNERRTFGSLADGWASQVEKMANEFLARAGALEAAE